MKLVPTILTQKIGQQSLLLQKNSPKILFAAGIAGSIVGTVLACRATLKLEETLDTFKHDIDQVKGLKGVEPDNEYRKDMAYVYIKNTVSLAKLYGPALIVSAASVGALTQSHVILTRRNTSLTAAYALMSASYDAYRERVRAEYGTEKELDLYHAVRYEEREIDGKKQMVAVADPNKWSPYARFFDEANPNWKKNPELNRLFVQCAQNYANHLLHARGHVFLNEVYDMLGLDHSSAGAVVGWVVGNGDNFIDFGIFETSSARFVNGYERTILLDFNVDGVIFDKI